MYNSPTFFSSARDNAIQWARDLLSQAPSTWAILDTETTGLRSHDQVVQIALIDGAGNVLIDNQLIKPTVEISEGAFSVHRILQSDLESAPPFTDFLPTLISLVAGRQIVIYNAPYDSRILSQSDPRGEFQLTETQCAMNEYSRFVGEYNDRFGSFRWQKLPHGDHTALGDCRAVLSLMRYMAESRKSTE